MFEDKTLTCRECGEQFVFSASEQQFYEEKGFKNEPSRCPACRQARKAAAGGRNGGSSRPPRQMYPAVCANCGAETEVPFQPTGDKPVYCRECYQAMRNS